MSIEIAVKVSNSERTLTEKHLLHESDDFISLSKTDLTLIALVDQATKAFGENGEDVRLKINFQWD